MLAQTRPYLREPVLHAGCGAGRLLRPWHDEGLDVDGCDASADMVARCRERAPGATLWVSALHELDPLRRSATIVASQPHGMEIFNLFTGELDEGRAARVGGKIGATKLGMTIYELPPGQAICPYPCEWTGEEWGIVLAGTAALRTPGASASCSPATPSASWDGERPAG